MKEVLSTNGIALLQNVSGSRIRQIWCHYRITKTIPILAKPGRPSRNITNEEISAVIGTYKEYPCNSTDIIFVMPSCKAMRSGLEKLVAEVENDSTRSINAHNVYLLRMIMESVTARNGNDDLFLALSRFYFLKFDSLGRTLF